MQSASVGKRRRPGYIFLIISSIVLYTTLTCSKNLYTAEKITLYESGLFGNLTNLASTMEYYFYVYAVTQILLAFVVKRINMKWFLTVTMSISAVLTLVIPFTDNITQHYIIFMANGFLQAGLWGGILKILSLYLPTRLLTPANQIMASGPAIAGALSYAISAAFGDNWRTPFTVMGIIVLLSAAFYFFSVTLVSRYPREVEMHHIVHSDGTEEDVSVDDENDFIHLITKRRILCFYVISMLMGVLFTSLYFMVNNNLDIYLREVGGFSPDVSKLLSVFAPLCAVVGPFVTVRLCEGFKNFVAVCASLFGLSLVVAVLMLLLFDKSVGVSLALLVLFIVLVNGARCVTLSVASLRMRSRIDTGTFSVAVNAISSIASGMPPKLIATILDNGSLTTVESWRVSFLIFAVVNAVVVVLLVGILILIKRLNAYDRRKAVAPTEFAL